MKGKRYIVLAVVIAVAVILAGLVLSPSVQKETPNTPGSPTSNPSNPGVGGNVGNYSVPAWDSGDSWTYNVTVGRSGIDTQDADGSPLLHGWVKEAVAGTESNPAGSVYNVTVTASYTLSDSFCSMEDSSSTYRTASVAGYILYRTSDLARVGAAWTLSMNGSYTYENQTFSYVYTASTWTTYAPALALWQFPLTANASWAAASNVSVHHRSEALVTYGNHTYTWNRSSNETFALDLAVRSGSASNVTVPAGTFGAIPVQVAAGHDDDLSDRVASEVMNVTTSVEMEPSHALAVLWYSGQVGNVVKAQATLGRWDDLSLRADLVAYTYP